MTYRQKDTRPNSIRNGQRQILPQVPLGARRVSMRTPVNSASSIESPHVIVNEYCDGCQMVKSAKARISRKTAAIIKLWRSRSLVFHSSFLHAIATRTPIASASTRQMVRVYC